MLETPDDRAGRLEADRMAVISKEQKRPWCIERHDWRQ